MQDLKVTLIQANLKWQDVDYNLTHFEKSILSIDSITDLIVLPEMFTTGFSMSPEILSEPIDGRSVSWMIKMASLKNSAICGSLMINENKSSKDSPYYVNKFVWVYPDGSILTYNKHHLFNLIEENKHFKQGNEHLIIPYKGWTIQPFICYDLRFPIWCRNVYNADLQIFVANWPVKRSDHWKTLLKARAIENQCYVLGVNRIGEDNNSNYHSGDSMIYNFAGETLFSLSDQISVHTEILSYAELASYRERYPFLKDQDKFDFKL